jgi:type VI secretion system secreted protein VgrG
VRLALGGAPAKDEDFIAEFRGQRIEGKTDGDGVLTLELSASVTAIELTLPKRNTQFMLRVGHLDPADTPQGSIARLRNLNIAQLTQSETLSEPLRAALKDFQRAHEIDETGELDDKTVDALKKTHGC